MFRRLAELFDAHRAKLALAVGLATIAAIVGLSRLQFDDIPRLTFRSHDAEFTLLEQVFRQFGADDVDCVLLVQGDDLFKPENVVALHRLIDEVGAVPGVDEVHSLADVKIFPRRNVPRALVALSRAVPPEPYSLLPAMQDDVPPTIEACEAARAKALKHPLAAGQLISDDSRATLVVAKLADDNVAVAQFGPVVERIRGLGAKFTSSSGLSVRLTGLAPIREEIFTTIRRESAKSVLFGGALTVVMATLMFRRPAAVAIVCGATLVGALWATGGMGLIGERMNILTTVVPTLVMVIGFTDAVHLMIDIRHERAEGLGPRAAAKMALANLGMPCLLCAVSTAVGFGSLSLAKMEVIQKFGFVCGLGVVLALAAVFTLVPLLSSTRLGFRIHSPPAFDVPTRIARGFEPVVRTLVNWPRLTTAIGGGITLAMTTSLFFLVPSSQSTEALSTDSPAFQAVQELDRSFGGSGSAQILVECDPSLQIDSPAVLQAIDEVQTFAASQPGVKNPVSIVNVIRALPGEGQSLARQAEWLRWVPAETREHYIRPDLNRALVRMRLSDVGSAEHTTLFDNLRAGFDKLEAEHPGVKYYLTGTAVMAARNLSQMIGDLAPSLGSAAIAIFIVMVVGFRSVRLGLIAVVPNLFPMVVAATYLVLTGRPLQMTSVIVFSVCLGIAVDDTIHFVNRYQREILSDGDVCAAILRTYKVVGAAQIMTALVLIAGFASLQISEMPTTRFFSGLSCLTIAAAVVGDLFLLPAMLRCFAKTPTATLSRGAVDRQDDEVLQVAETRFSAGR